MGVQQIRTGALYGAAVGVTAAMIKTASIFGIPEGFTVVAITSNPSLIIACIAVGVAFRYVYTRMRVHPHDVHNVIIDQVIANNQVDVNDVLANDQPLGLPPFQPIDMTREQFENITDLAQDDFNETVSRFICRFSNKVTRKPYRMTCCLNNPNNFAEKVYLERQLNKHGICPFCTSRANITQMRFYSDKDTHILGLRMKLVKVYRKATDNQKTHWKELIDRYFGAGYTLQHLENFQFSQLSD